MLRTDYSVDRDLYIINFHAMTKNISGSFAASLWHAYHKSIFFLGAACRRYLLAFGMNVFPLSSMRAWLLSACGVKIGKDCYIGFGVFVDTNYPQLITIGSHVTISHHCALLTHSQSPILPHPLCHVTVMSRSCHGHVTVPETAEPSFLPQLLPSSDLR